MKRRVPVLLLVTLALGGCTTVKRPAGPTAAELHQALAACKARYPAHSYAAVNYCFAEARRKIAGNHSVRARQEAGDHLEDAAGQSELVG
jgi:hypothetical protein